MTHPGSHSSKRLVTKQRYHGLREAGFLLKPGLFPFSIFVLIWPYITSLLLHTTQGPQVVILGPVLNEHGWPQNVHSAAVPEQNTLQNSAQKRGAWGLWTNLAMFLQCDSHRKENFPHPDVPLFQVLPDLAPHPFFLPKHVFFCPSHGIMKCSGIMALKCRGISEVLEHFRPHHNNIPGKGAPMDSGVSFKHNNPF